MENSLALLLDQVNRGRCALTDVVRWMCDAPARVWDILDKGRIAEGYDADLVLVDLAKSRAIRDKDQFTKSCGGKPCSWTATWIDRPGAVPRDTITPAAAIGPRRRTESCPRYAGSRW